MGNIYEEAPFCSSLLLLCNYIQLFEKLKKHFGAGLSFYFSVLFPKSTQKYTTFEIVMKYCQGVYL